MHFLWPCAGETQILTFGDASSVQMKWIHEESQPDEQNRHGATAARRKKISRPEFGTGETQILTSGVAFSVALRSKKRGGQKFAPGPKRLYPYRKNPSVRHTVWGKRTAEPRLQSLPSVSVVLVVLVVAVVAVVVAVAVVVVASLAAVA